MQDTEKGLQLTVPSGSMELAWHPAGDGRPETTVLGLDLLVPGGANPELGEAACDLAFTLAEACSLWVYHPQLGRAVSGRDAEAVRARMARFASYLTETVGLDEAADARHISVGPPRVRLALRTPFYLMLAVGLAPLAFLARYC